MQRVEELDQIIHRMSTYFTKLTTQLLEQHHEHSSFIWTHYIYILKNTFPHSVYLFWISVRPLYA